MKPTLSLNIGRVGFFCSIERAKTDVAAVHKDVGAIAHLSSSFILDHPEKTASVISMRSDLVLPVKRPCEAAKVGYTVIRLVVIDMVNVMGRPFAVEKQPCQSVRVDACSCLPRPDADVDVAAAMEASRLSAYRSALRDLALRENSRFGVVVEKFAELFRSKIGNSHDALHLLIGKKPGAMGSRCPASSL